MSGLNVAVSVASRAVIILEAIQDGHQMEVVTFRPSPAFSRAALMILLTLTCDILVIVQIDRMDIPSFARLVTRSTSREIMRASSHLN